MKSNAPGQFLGYAIQFPRALLHLLKAGPGDCVSIEHLGDVAIGYSDGTALVEEDKSSISVNPLTDKSENLWKTFSNWVDAINDFNLDIEKTSFLLFANKSGNKGLVDLFHNAIQGDEAKKAIADAKNKLKDTDKKHPIWPYYNKVVNENEAVFMGIIQRFSLEISENGPYEEIKKELVKKHVGKHQIKFITEKIGGWLQKKIIEKIQRSEPAIIFWNDYDKKFKEFYERSRRRELIDFTLETPPNKGDIKSQLKSHPLYVRQLEKIEETEDDIIEAVCDFLKAKSNRQNWIEDELIDEEIAMDFESKLQDFWKNHKKQIDITQASLDLCKKGQLLYASCKNRQQTIGDKEPPARTIAGTYHLLSDTLTLGWHPGWEKFKEKK